MRRGYIQIENEPVKFGLGTCGRFDFDEKVAQGGIFTGNLGSWFPRNLGALHEIFVKITAFCRKTFNCVQAK